MKVGAPNPCLASSSSPAAIQASVKTRSSPPMQYPAGLPCRRPQISRNHLDGLPMVIESSNRHRVVEPALLHRGVGVIFELVMNTMNPCLRDI